MLKVNGRKEGLGYEMTAWPEVNGLDGKVLKPRDRKRAEKMTATGLIGNWSYVERGSRRSLVAPDLAMTLPKRPEPIRTPWGFQSVYGAFVAKVVRE
jgi:hypothetical protein